MARTLVLVAAFCLCSVAHADEGLWLLDQLESLPLEQMHEKGLSARPSAIRELAQAIVRIDAGGEGGGTGSFVSAEGLILTNHHVAHQCLAVHSDSGSNLLAAGFVAPGRADEIRCPGFEVLVPLEQRDVTGDVQKPEDEKLTAAERGKQRDARRNRLAAACQGDRADRRCEVEPFFGGVRERLVAYDVLSDVRLAHAPEETLAVFGGDIDNFEWPRHTADYSFLRAYAGGQPYRSGTFLRPALDGYREGSFVMAFGFPAGTDRYAPAAELEVRLRDELPRRLARLRAAIAAFERHAAASAAARLAVIDELRNLANAEKAYAGTLSGLERQGGAATRRDAERQLAAWIAADPARQKRYGTVLAEIERLAAARATHVALLDAFDGFRRGPASARWAFAIAERATERAKPDDERRDGYHDREAPVFRARVVDDPAPAVPAVEEELLAKAVSNALALPAGSRIAAVDALAKGREGDVPRSIAKELLAGSRIAAREARESYLALASAQLATSGDRLLAFAAGLERQRALLVDRLEREIDAPLDDARRLYAAALLEWRGAALYPDANFTLRFSHGEVAGYYPYPRGSRLGYATTVPSLLATATDHPDYRLREEVVAQLAGRTLPAFVDRDLNAEPVNFIATLDSSGGSSGSPVLDGRGRLYGVLFDGNYESLASDVVFDAGRTRAIVVDIRFVLDLMVRVYGAEELVREIGP